MEASEFDGAVSGAVGDIVNNGVLYGPSAKAFADAALVNPHYLSQIADMREEK